MTRTVAVALFFTLGLSAWSAAPALEDVLAGAGEQRRPEQAWFLLASEVASTSGGATTVFATSEENLWIDDGQMRHEQRVLGPDVVADNIQAWDGRVLAHLAERKDSLYRHVPALTIRASTSPPYAWTRLFPDLTVWRERPSATVETLDGGLVRVADAGRVDILDASQGYACLLSAQRPTPRRGERGSPPARVILYHDYRELEPGVHYPAESVSFMAPGLDFRRLRGPDVPVPPGARATRLFVRDARTEFISPRPLGTIAPEPGWRVADHTLAAATDLPLEYVYRQELTDAEKQRMYQQQLAEVRQQEAPPVIAASTASLVGQPHPALDGLRFLSGDIHNASELTGRVILVGFWATWCIPYRNVIGRLEELQRQYADEGLIVIGVSPEEEAKVREFLTRRAVQYPIAIAPETRLLSAYGVAKWPTYVIIDRNGIVEFRRAMVSIDEPLLDAIKKALTVKRQGNYMSQPLP